MESALFMLETPATAAAFARTALVKLSVVARFLPFSE